MQVGTVGTNGFSLNNLRTSQGDPPVIVSEQNIPEAANAVAAFFDPNQNEEQIVILTKDDRGRDALEEFFRSGSCDQLRALEESVPECTQRIPVTLNIRTPAGEVTIFEAVLEPHVVN